jgi:hypothetical protein
MITETNLIFDWLVLRPPPPREREREMEYEYIGLQT